MPLTRGKALGYDADLMAFKFTMRNRQQTVQCQISTAALTSPNYTVSSKVGRHFCRPIFFGALRD